MAGSWSEKLQISPTVQAALTMAAGTAQADDIVATATPKDGSAAAGITNIQGCVDTKTGAIEIEQQSAALTGC